MCPTAGQAQFHQGDHPSPSFIVEVVASPDLCFLHAIVGVVRSNNEINVVEHSSIFDDIIDGVEPAQSFYANGVQFNHDYYLIYEIYNEWSMLVQAYASPVEDKRNYFKKQESSLKDIEKAFGVLKKNCHLILRPLWILSGEKIRDVVYTCIILHNMVLENQVDDKIRDRDSSSDLVDGMQRMEKDSNMDREDLETVISNALTGIE
ncbi:uncharacterized protein LOC143552009 [Bidens hawaiensis]|uniref:uncharacterized protein LOC143552009 n=1 Tax=Bidens hawaiensis TaxID=980011 RepID=UPI00404AA62F